MSHEVMEGFSGSKLQTFKSDLSEWNKLHTIFSSSDMRALSKKYTNFLNNMQSANNAITAAGIEGISPINVKITQGEITRLNSKLDKLQDFTKDIHSNVKKLVDEPFYEQLRNLLCSVQEHDHFFISIGDSTYDLGDIEDKDDAHNKIVYLLKYGEKSNLEIFYEEYQKSENYNPEVLARYRMAEKIINGGAPYSQEFIDSWLLKEDNYLAYLVVKQMMQPEEDQEIGSFLESVSNRNKAMMMLEPNFTMTAEQEKQARAMADSEIVKMNQKDVKKYSSIYDKRHTDTYDREIRKLNEKEKVEYAKYEIFRMLKDKTSMAVAYTNGIEGYSIPIRRWIDLAKADIEGTALEMLGVKPYGYAQQWAEDIESEYDRIAVDKANSMAQHHYSTIAGGATVDFALYYVTGGILESYGLTAGMSATAAFATNQYVQFVQDTTISYLPHYLEYVADGDFSDAERATLLNEMLWGEAANLGLGTLDVFVKAKYVSPMASSLDRVEIANESQKSLNEVNEYAANYNKNAKEPLVNGPYIRDGKPYGRPGPTGKQKLKFEQEVYDKQVSPDGILREPYPPYREIDWKPGQPRQGVVDFGHEEGKCYNDMFLKYRDRDISLQELKDFQENPENFRIEIPSPNRGHAHE